MQERRLLMRFWIDTILAILIVAGLSTLVVAALAAPVVLVFI